MGTEEVKSDTEEVKSEVVEETKTLSDLESKIVKQVEYYFGNYNLKKDKFLRDQTKVDDGWIPLETMIKFNRLKSLSSDFNVICEALKKSSNDLMEVHEDGSKIRRNPSKPLPDDTYSSDDVKARSLYMKGFRLTATLDELLDFFKDHKVENIQMRRKPHKKTFKGSCFVLFETVEDAARFLGLKGIKFESTELLLETKEDYFKRKDELFKNLREERAKKKVKTTDNSGDKADKSENSENGKEEKEQEIEFTPGCLLKLTELSSKMTREHLKENLEKYGEIAYVDYSKGLPEGVVRFSSAVAEKVLEDAEIDNDVKRFPISDVKAIVSVIEGDSENAYYKSVADRRANRPPKQFGRGRGRGRFRGGGGWNKRQRGHQREGAEGEPPAKRTKDQAD